MQLSGYEEFKKFKNQNSTKSQLSLQPFQLPEKKKFNLENLTLRLTRDISPYQRDNGANVNQSGPLQQHSSRSSLSIGKVSITPESTVGSPVVKTKPEAVLSGAKNLNFIDLSKQNGAVSEVTESVAETVDSRLLTPVQPGEEVDGIKFMQV